MFILLYYFKHIYALSCGHAWITLDVMSQPAHNVICNILPSMQMNICISTFSGSIVFCWMKKSSFFFKTLSYFGHQVCRS